MILILLLCIVVGFKYFSFQEHFCKWLPKMEKARISRDEAKRRYFEKEEEYKNKLQMVKDKQYEINMSNSDLENSFLKATTKFENVLNEYKNLSQQLNKTTINQDNCENMNKLKLNAIKKIYS
jgi:predicted metallo-beta-lactamase superfamily hydrolase